MFADTHCHLDFESFAGRTNIIANQMNDVQLEMVVIPSVGVSNWEKVISLCSEDRRFYFALGLHPYFIEAHKMSHISLLENKVMQLRSSKNFVGIGEIGLDATRPEMDKQLALFEMQLQIAEKFQLPVIIHVRKAHSQMHQLLKKYSLAGGVIHAFSGSFELMMSYINLGFKIGVGPVITWHASNKTRSAIQKAPLSSLVLETDAPDMYVEGSEKTQSSPLDVLKVFSVLSNVRSEDCDYVRNQLWLNSLELINKTVDSIKL